MISVSQFRRLSILLSFLLVYLSASSQSSKMNGLSFVAPPEAFTENPMSDITAINANWIAVIPFGFSYSGKAFVRFNESKFQWWGERPEGVIKTVQMAHEAGLKVLMKPQVYVPGSWPGGIDFEKEEDWVKWEADYSKYILEFAQIAADYNVEMLCIGTEFKIALQKRPDYWKTLIVTIREIYSGPLTYAANWDEFFSIPSDFWKLLDYAGLDAYFPLNEDKTPSIKALKKAWEPIKKRIVKRQSEIDLPIIFTEYGYLSIDGCAGKAWELEQQINQRPINQQAQANAIEALFQTFYQEDWWAGGFIWKWFPKMAGHEGYPEKDYTPQGKMSQTVLKSWFSK